MTRRSPNIAQVIQGALDEQASNMHTCMPGEVVEYDAATNTAQVKPLLGKSQFDEEGNELSLPYPNMYTVPVVWPRSSGYVFRFPVEAGDTCLLVFAEADIENWQDTGKVSDPEDDRRFDLSDAVAFMGFFSKPQEESTATDTGEIESGMVLGKDGADSRIFIDDSKIELGGQGASDKAVLHTKVRAELDLIQAEFVAIRTALTALEAQMAAHVHADLYVIPLIPLPGPQPGPVIPTPPVTPQLSNYAPAYTAKDTNSDLVTIKK